MDFRSYQAQAKASAESGGLVPHPMWAPHDGVNLSGTSYEAMLRSSSTQPKSLLGTTRTAGSGGSLFGILTFFEMGACIWWVFDRFGFQITALIVRARLADYDFAVRVGIGIGVIIGYMLALWILMWFRPLRWLTVLGFAALWAYLGYMLMGNSFFGFDEQARRIAAGVFALIALGEKAYIASAARAPHG
ncbi:MAG: hypothetical protein WDN44_04680 [Sphingomonas sp.]